MEFRLLVVVRYYQREGAALTSQVLGFATKALAEKTAVSLEEQAKRTLGAQTAMTVFRCY